MPALAKSRLSTGAVATGEDTLVLMPGDYRLGSDPALPLVLVGVGAGSQAWAARIGHLWHVAAQGFMVVCGSYTGINTFGTDAVIARIEATYQYAVAQGWGLANDFMTIGFSMGNQELLNWGRTKTLSDWKGHISCEGLMNVEDVHANNRGGYAATIDAAYGGTWSNAVHGADHNPVVYASELTSVPVITYYSELDAVAVPAEDAAFATAHGNTTRNSLGQVGHGAATVVLAWTDLADDILGLRSGG